MGVQQLLFKSCFRFANTLLILLLGRQKKDEQRGGGGARSLYISNTFQHVFLLQLDDCTFESFARYSIQPNYMH